MMILDKMLNLEHLHLLNCQYVLFLQMSIIQFIKHHTRVNGEKNKSLIGIEREDLANLSGVHPAYFALLIPQIHVPHKCSTN